MRILVIGSGGREHALVWKLRQSPRVSDIFVAPGNGGTCGEGATNVPVAVDDLDALVALARREKIDLVVPGPELPLTLGIVDRMREAGIACFGPDAYGARLEGSKAFAKEIMRRAGVPTARCAVFSDAAMARQYVAEVGAPLVIKADGLAAGKGVVVAESSREALQAISEIMDDRAFGAAGDRVVLEERLVGEEASFLCFCDGERAVPLPSAQDHKAAWDGDKGPNTGGMGAYSPAPVLSDEQLERMADLTIRPVLRELAGDGHPFVGVLYAGLMLTADGPRVLEYNVRFGDPECQPLLARLEGDLAQVMLDCVNGGLNPASFGHSARTALGVVLTARGYPREYPKGLTITGIEAAEALPGVKVFHSGTTIREQTLVSSGGRVLCVTALGDDLPAAQKAAYAALEKISMPDGFYRTDIGDKGIRRLTGRPETPGAAGK
ncbi:phosphoribosylamine--glycine ligase [Desulfovibrio sp. SGI.169]|uniref:phosphoribosylamine--glycine ligase n=1 Tax=Desulfovibrio sp. SGI.169 TaxID=3420561 RepID=UPI003D003183